jgi:hypothetical protein
MDTQIFIKNFFLYFYILFIKIFFMISRGFLIFMSFVFICNYAYGLTWQMEGSSLNPIKNYIIESPDDVNDSAFDDPGSQYKIRIKSGGEYNLSRLDAISGDAKSGLIDVGSDNAVVLVADSGFDGVFDTELLKESLTRIVLTDDFLASVTGDELLRFNDITMDGVIYIDEEHTSSTYSYSWTDCATGKKCIKRTYSDSYLLARQSQNYEARLQSNGVANNPNMLLRPMNVITKHELFNVYDFSDEFFVSLSPEYYNAKHFQNVGIRMNFGTKIGGRLSIGAVAYAMRSDFKNDVSDFKSNVYGGNLRFNYDIDEVMFLRGVGGLNFATIDCDNVVKENGVVSNPDAFGLYGGIDFGAKFNFESGLFLSPFIGVGTTQEYVVDVKEKDSFIRAGGDVGYKYFMDGVTYSYILRAGLDTHGYFDASVGINAYTVSDKIGGGVLLGLVDTDFGLSGKVSANIKFVF